MSSIVCWVRFGGLNKGPLNTIQFVTLFWILRAPFDSKEPPVGQITNLMRRQQLNTFFCDVLISCWIVVERGGKKLEDDNWKKGVAPRQNTVFCFICSIHVKQNSSAFILWDIKHQTIDKQWVILKQTQYNKPFLFFYQKTKWDVTVLSHKFVTQNHID